MQLPYSDELDIRFLSRIFDNKSECYKLFWFQAMISKITEGKTVISFEELVDDMAAEAWYMVTEYHLNLGPNDTLEKLVNYIQQATHMKPSEKKERILEYLKKTDDSEVIKHKKTLIKNVPYRLQAPFMTDMKGNAWKASEAKLAERVNDENQKNRLMYYFNTFQGLRTTIAVDSEWVFYIKRNAEILCGWLQYNMILYLQKRNPSVPGIANKLYPPQEQKLEKVRKYWRLLMSIHPFHEIYGHKELSRRDLSIDHFVPWSYVAHDELWNLHPTTREINSSKSNNLPDWDKYFPELAKIEYISYQMMWEYPNVHDEFEKCAKEHLNNDELKYRIYHKGQTYDHFTRALQDAIEPVYQSAVNCGFRSWSYLI